MYLPQATRSQDRGEVDLFSGTSATDLSGYPLSTPTQFPSQFAPESWMLSTHMSVTSSTAR